MRQIQDQGAFVRKITTLVTADHGGTGGSDASSACTQLQAISRDRIGQNGGLVQLTDNGRFPAKTLATANAVIGALVSGPETVYYGCRARFRFTNFNTAQEPKVTLWAIDPTSTSEGDRIEARWMADVLFFNVPSDEKYSTVRMMISTDDVNRIIDLPIKPFGLGRPSILSPLSGSYFSGQPLVDGYPLITVSIPEYLGEAKFYDFGYDYEDLSITGFGTHLKEGEVTSEYTTYSGHQRIVIDRPASTLYLAGRLSNEDNYAFAIIDGKRYELGTSFMEYVVHLKTSYVVELFVHADEKLYLACVPPYFPPDATNVEFYCQPLFEGSDDGETWFDIGMNEAGTDQLSYYVSPGNQKDCLVRVRHSYMVTSDNEGFGPFISEPSDPILLKYTATASDLVFERTIVAPYVNSSYHFGKSIAVDESVSPSRLFVGSEGSGGVQNELVYCYQESSDAYFSYQDAVMLPEENTRNAVTGFGDSVAVSDDGNLLYIGAPDATYSDLPDVSGAVYVYKKINDIWLFQQKIIDTTNGSVKFGTALAQVGNVLLVSSGVGVAKSKLFLYAIYDESDVPNYTLKNTYVHPGLDARSVFFDIGIVRHSDYGLNVLPVFIGARTSTAVWAGDGVYCGVLDATNYSLTLNAALCVKGGAGIVDGVYGLGYSLEATYRLYDENTDQFTGKLYLSNPVERKFYSYDWRLNTDQATLSVDTNSVQVVSDLSALQTTQYLGGLASTRNGFRIFFGDMTADVSYQEATTDQTTVVDEAGIIHIHFIGKETA